MLHHSWRGGGVFLIKATNTKQLYRLSFVANATLNEIRTKHLYVLH